MEKKCFAMFLASAMLFPAIGMAAGPLLKTGACPTLTRSAPNSQDDWGQFPIKPTSQFVNNCSTTTPQNCTLQNAIPPAQSINCVQVPSDLMVEGVSSELLPGPAPSLAYIMDFDFDERGRVWAAEPRDYPYPIVSDRLHGGKGRIVILEDTNGDGAMDLYKVFYTGLVMPTSVEVVNGGIIATVEPDIVFIPASTTNPDTAGGPPVVLFSGMGNVGNGWDTHGSINSVTKGLDNWYYGHIGYNDSCSAVAGTGGGAGVSCPGGGVWRFKSTSIGSDSTSFQSFSTGPSNAHGLGQMEDGQIFQSGATGSSHSNHAIYLGHAAISTLDNTTNYSNTTPANAYYPITGDRYIWDFSTAGGSGTASVSTATSGHDFYTARLLPQKYWNTRAFVCEGASKLCNQDSLVINGSTWKDIRLPGPTTSNIFASTDAWTAPIKVKTGPDGGLWILDWGNYLFLHNPASPSTNAAWQNALRSKTQTRLYRLLPPDGSTDPVLDLSNATTAQLVNALYNTNFFWRMTAQRLLIGKGYSAELGDSLKNILMNHRTSDTVGIDGPVINALWTLEGLNRFTADSVTWNPILKNLLLHPAWGVRENVLKAMPRTAISAQAINDQCAADDPHPHVRLQAYLALAASPAAPSGAVQGHYSATDSWATEAFNKAGSSKLVAATPANTRPSTCPALLSAVAVLADHRMQARDDLHFTMIQNGFELQSYGQLPSGEMKVYDIQGHIVFHSEYDAGKSQWSAPAAKGLHAGLYFYLFRGVNGDQFNGRITMASDI